MDAGEWWARRLFIRQPDDAGLDQDDQKYVTVSILEDPTAQYEEEFVLWPDNLPAWQVFSRCERHWKIIPSGLNTPERPHSIPPTEVIAVMGLMEIEDPLAVLDDVEILQRGAAKVFNDKFQPARVKPARARKHG